MPQTNPIPPKKPFPVMAAAIIGVVILAALLFAFQNQLTLPDGTLPSANPRLIFSNFLSAESNVQLQSSSSPYLTIYNNNLASVSQPYSVALVSGDNTISYSNIPSQIIPSSVFVVDSDASTQIQKQEYVFDTFSSDALLNRHLGENISLVVDNGNSVQSISGVLRSFQNDLILETASGIESISRIHVVSMQFNDAAGLSTQPSLVWDVRTTNAGQHELQLSYLTEGMGWQTNYAIEYDESASTLNLHGWADVSNSTDFTFDNAKLSLVAGQVNRAYASPPLPYYAKNELVYDAVGTAASSAPSFGSSTVSEYHRYDLTFPTTIKSHSSQQLNLLESENIPVTRELVFDSYSAGAVKAILKFKNEKSAGLGVPLPSGIARVYTNVVNAGRTFVGEDAVENTPEDKEVELQIGEVFDVRGERKVIDSQYPSKGCTRSNVEVELTNAKSQAESVKVVEHTYGDTQISGNNFPFEIKDAQTFEFVVPIPSKSTQTLKFTTLSCYPQY